jgi:hypothetical protein
MPKRYSSAELIKMVEDDGWTPKLRSTGFVRVVSSSCRANMEILDFSWEKKI